MEFSLKILAGHESGIRSVAIDGAYVVTSSDDTARIWDRNTGNCLHILKGHEREVVSVAIDGAYVVTGSYDLTARIWDRNTGNCLHILKGHDREVASVTIDGIYVVTGSWDNTVRVWDRNTGGCLHILKDCQSSFSSVAIAGKYAITSAGKNMTASIWDLTSPQERVLAFAAALQNRCGATAPARILDQNLVREIVRLIRQDAVSDACLHILKGHVGFVYSVAIDENYVITGSGDKTVRIWDRNTGKCLHILKGHEDGVTAVAMEGSCVVTGSWDHTARIWDRNTGNCLHIFEGHGHAVFSVAIDGKHVVTGSEDKTARIWDLTSPQERVLAFAAALQNRCGATAPARILDQNLVRAIGKLVKQNSVERTCSLSGKYSGKW